MKRPFKMLTLKQVLSQVCPGDWFFSVDLKDAYLHIQITPHYRPFFRFTFKGVAYQYTVLRTVSGPVHFYEVYGCTPLPSETESPL